jgi:hypothetical protein
MQQIGYGVKKIVNFRFTVQILWKNENGPVYGLNIVKELKWSESISLTKLGSN